MEGSCTYRTFKMMPQQSARNRRRSFESERRQRRTSTSTEDSQNIWESSNNNSNSPRSGGGGGGVAGALSSMSTSFANALEAPLRYVDINQGNNGRSATPKRRFSRTDTDSQPSLNPGNSFAPQSIPQHQQQQCWTASDRSELVDRTPKLKSMLNEAIESSGVVTAAAYKAVHHQFLYSDAVEREVQLANERRSNNRRNILNLKPPSRLGSLLRSRSSIGIENNNTSTASQSQLIGGSCRSLMVSASKRLSVGSAGGTVSTLSSSSRRCSWNPVTSGDNSDSRRGSWNPTGGGGGSGDSRRGSWHPPGGGGSSDPRRFSWNPPGGGSSSHSRRGSWNPLSKSNTNGDRDVMNSNIAPIKSSMVMVLSQEDQQRILSHEEEEPASDCHQQDFGRKSLLMKSLVGIEDWSQSDLQQDDGDDDDSFNKFLQRQGSDASLNLQDIFDGTEGAPFLESSPPPVPPAVVVVVDDDGDDDEPQSELKASLASAETLSATCCTTLSRMGTLYSDIEGANNPDPDTGRIIVDLSNSKETNVGQVLKSSVQSSEHSYMEEFGWLPWPNTDPNEDNDDDGSICNNGLDLLEPFHVPRLRHNSCSTSFSTPSRPKLRDGDNGTIGNVGDDLLVSFHLSYQGEDSFVSWGEERRIGHARAA